MGPIRVNINIQEDFLCMRGDEVVGQTLIIIILYYYYFYLRPTT